MNQYVKPERRAKILSAIHDDGMSIGNAAKTFLVAEKTIFQWLLKQARGAHVGALEIQRLKQDNHQLKQIIGRCSRESKKGNDKVYSAVICHLIASHNTMNKVMDD